MFYIVYAFILSLVHFIQAGYKAKQGRFVVDYELTSNGEKSLHCVFAKDYNKGTATNNTEQKHYHGNYTLFIFRQAELHQQLGQKARVPGYQKRYIFMCTQLKIGRTYSSLLFQVTFLHL